VAERKKLGEIFVEQRILSALTVERIVAISQKLNKRFGTVLEEMGLITGQELAAALAIQYGCKTAGNFAGASFPPQLLGIIKAGTALQELIFPLKLEPGKLHVAVSDPTPSRILSNIGANNEVAIVPYVATRHEIKAAICRHYLGMTLDEPVRKTVLVAEDDKLVLTLLRNLLKDTYDVVTASDGMEAFKEAVSRKPHVILTDNEMPKLDGFGLFGALQSTPETRAIPVILISGSATAEAEAKAFEKGFFDFIPKPVKEATILTRVKRAYDYNEQGNYLFLR
jgi:CheY-like chemotaxis protein